MISVITKTIGHGITPALKLRFTLPNKLTGAIPNNSSREKILFPINSAIIAVDKKIAARKINNVLLLEKCSLLLLISFNFLYTQKVFQPFPHILPLHLSCHRLPYDNSIILSL